MTLDSLVVPLVMCVILLAGIRQKVELFDVFLDGAKEGITTAVAILPSLVALMTCVGMFKASGVLDIVSFALQPVSQAIGLPAEVIPLAILRPISGSGALVIFNGLLESFGADSLIGRVASVMEGSSETTFYTIAVYYGAVRVRQTRHTLPASLTADLVGVLMSAWAVKWVFG